MNTRLKRKLSAITAVLVLGGVGAVIVLTHRPSSKFDDVGSPAKFDTT
jgi:hypothetical protein